MKKKAEIIYYLAVISFMMLLISLFVGCSASKKIEQSQQAQQTQPAYQPETQKQELPATTANVRVNNETSSTTPTTSSAIPVQPASTQDSTTNASGSAGATKNTTTSTPASTSTNASSSMNSSNSTSSQSQTSIATATTTIASTREFTIKAKQFEFIPGAIEVNQGDDVVLKITSIDVQHGFTIADFGVEEILKPNTEVVVKFKADKQGTFTFYCSYYCGGGHPDMHGKLVVR